MEVRWPKAAEADLEYIRDFIARDNVVAAQIVAAAIKEAGNSLGAFPYKGHAGEDGTREWVVPKFRR